VPNGGSDCCGTCWFNTRNKGEAGYGHAGDLGPASCAIRDFAIKNPFYTYCGNHPHRRPEKDLIPIGPVYTGDSSGQRTLWKNSPDTEAIRLHLLKLLEEMAEEPVAEYPIGTHSDEVVVWQLGAFKEPRAIEHLQRIVSFDPATSSAGPFGHDRLELVAAAREALENIMPKVKYQVFVDDNYHYMDESDRMLAGTYNSLDEAIEKCKEITLSSLAEFYEAGISPEKLSAQWSMFGQDPFIRGHDGPVPFSARKFITTELCESIIKSRQTG
jgi:hypothetical protein